MHRRVELIDAQGDIIHGVEREGTSDMPPVITCGPQAWWPETWLAHGWSLSWAGEWEW